MFVGASVLCSAGASVSVMFFSRGVDRAGSVGALSEIALCGSGVGFF